MVLLAALLAAAGCEGEPGTVYADAANDVIVDGGDVGTGDAEPDTVDDVTPDGGDAIGADAVSAIPGVSVRFDTAATLEGDDFFALPIPLDARLDDEGRPQWAGLPHPARIRLVGDLVEQAEERFGWPTMPVVFFQFDGELPPHEPSTVIAAAADSPVIVVDVDETSPERGRFVPTVVHTLPADAYAPDHTLAVAPRPGFLLRPHTTYAVVVRRAFGDAAGEPLGVPIGLRWVLRGRSPGGRLGNAVFGALSPALGALADAGVAADEIAALTVFTTGDPSARLAALSDRVVAQTTPTVSGFRVAEGGGEHARFCVLEAELAMPQFQEGTPPFSAGGGTFAIDRTGHLEEQREEAVPIVLTLPRRPMPDGGYPVVTYLHGTGGTTMQVVDRGPVLVEGGARTPGEGPAHVLAARGFATVGTALPLNPQRTPGAGDLAYITGNLLAFRDNIGQGAIEQRLTFNALERLVVPAEVVAECGDGLVDVGEVSLDTEQILLMGQSQGGHYANVVAALDPRVTAVVPTGAGGYQSWLILIQPNSDLGRLLPALLEADSEMTFTHPAMAVLQAAWEVVEPMVYMRRLHESPIDGRAATSVYAPVAPGDSFYPEVIYDAVSVAYASPQAGDAFWPEMQAALDLVGRDGTVPYPVVANVADGEATAAIVQYQGDGLDDPHGVFAQLDAIKYQYGCFFASALRDGVPTLPAPDDLDAACP